MTERIEKLSPCFVEFIPHDLDSGVLYISMKYATTSHLCCCGCLNRVVLPLHPTDWWLKFNGKGVTMRPSVGNWGFRCRSHYLITDNMVRWAGAWDDEEILAGRANDKARKLLWQTRGIRSEVTKNPVAENNAFPRAQPRGIMALLKHLVRKTRKTG